MKLLATKVTSFQADTQTAVATDRPDAAHSRCTQFCERVNKLFAFPRHYNDSQQTVCSPRHYNDSQQTVCFPQTLQRQPTNCLLPQTLQRQPTNCLLPQTLQRQPTKHNIQRKFYIPYSHCYCVLLPPPSRTVNCNNYQS
jgi:hypothetical protein